MLFAASASLNIRMAKYLREIIEKDLLFEETFDKYNDGLHFGHAHEHDVGGHNVRVSFLRGNHSKPGHYHANFEVDDHVDKGQVSDKHASHKIIHHIGRVIHSFVKEKKPTALHMMAFDSQDATHDKKAGMYHHFAKHLAKRYNGIVKTTESGKSIVHFKPLKTAKYLQRRMASI